MADETKEATPKVAAPKVAKPAAPAADTAPAGGTSKALDKKWLGVVGFIVLVVIVYFLYTRYMA